MSTIKVEGNGNFVFQSHSGSGDNIGGNKIVITNNHMTPQQLIQNLVGSNKIEDAIKALYQVPGINSNDVVLLQSRWTNLSREQRLGMLSYSEHSQQTARIVAAILSYAGCDTNATPTNRPAQPTQTPQGWEPQLLQIIRDNDRKNTDNVKRATTLLEAFRSYYDLKRTRSFFDRSGEKLQEIQDKFEAFKKTLNKSENESVEKFIDRVADHIAAAIPDWPSIAEAYRLCLGRGFIDSFIDRNLTATPNDDDAKLKAVQAIETFLGTL